MSAVPKNPSNNPISLRVPWPVYSYCTVFNPNHSRDGDTGKITAYQKSWRDLAYPWEYKLEFSDGKTFWFNSNSLELVKRAKEDQIPGE
jgi:hypothetical protein